MGTELEEESSEMWCQRERERIVGSFRGQFTAEWEGSGAEADLSSLHNLF